MMNETLLELQNNLSQALTLLRDRTYTQSKVKVYASMTGFNKLALLMQKILDQAQNKTGMQGQGQGSPSAIPSMAEWQKQLQEQVQQLKKGQQQGEAFSEELVRMIAKQEAIRQALEETGRNQVTNKQQEKEIKQLTKEMKDIEQALANQQLDRKLLQKQARVQTRLLEIEKSMREQGKKK